MCKRRGTSLRVQRKGGQFSRRLSFTVLSCSAQVGRAMPSGGSLGPERCFLGAEASQGVRSLTSEKGFGHDEDPGDGVCGEKEKCGGGTFLESFFGI